MSSSKGSPIRRLQLFQKQIAPAPKVTDFVMPKQPESSLSSELFAKNLELQQLYQENKLIKLKFQDQLDSYEKTISLMEKQLKESEKCRQEQFNIIKERYDKIAVEESQNLKNYHEHEIEFLLKQIAHLRAEATIKEEQLALKESQLENMKESYERQIQQKMSEITNLHKKYLTFEENKNRQIKELNNRRQLEKSRTSGLVSSRKENNQFMDKQLRKLNEQVLDKTIKIQSISRELNKLKKKHEETEKSYTKKFEEMITEREEESAEREAHFTKIENSLKQQILQFKANELKLLGQVDTQQGQIEKLMNQIGQIKSTCEEKSDEIRGLKEILEKQRDDHANEISRLLKQRKKKSSNMGSSRSLGSSMKDSQQLAADLGVNSAIKNSVRLPTVKEQTPDKYQDKSLENSQISVDDEQHELSKAVYHYDALINELRKSHESQIELLNHKINKVTRILEEKQQQVLDILTRFSPLVKIHAQEKSVQQDRKQRIERHWKADLGVLQILLKKYKIKTFE